LVVAGLLTAVVGAGLGAAAVAEGDASRDWPREVPTGGTTAIEVVDRLREIFRVHDNALLTRDASLLDGVFHPDCPCLDATRERIWRLRDTDLLWSDYSSTISDVRVRPPRDGTWAVTATLTGSSTRVETPTRELVRILPPERERWEFRLRRATDGGRLLLTAAEPRR
jgi:hypothetical protein